MRHGGKRVAPHPLSGRFEPAVSHHPLSFFAVLSFGLTGMATPLQLRIATFNASLNRTSPGQLASDLSTNTNNQARRVAEIIQRVRPDILLLNEFDYDSANPNLAADRFHNNYLAVSQGGQAALSYPYRYTAPSNTGVPTGKTLAAEGDFDNNGSVTTTTGSNNYGNDCYGFGLFPGQYSFAVYSRFPIQTQALRSFQLFKWKDMPGAASPPGYYTAAELNIFRLSSKNHVDLPIEVSPGHVLHLLASHPTPPAFDGTEDRNGRRNHDEIRLWSDYISNRPYLYDDAGVFGGLSGEQRFVILGDLNADPLDGDSYLGAVNQLRSHPLINADLAPASPGATQQATAQGGVNSSQTGNPAHDTSDFFDGSGGSGNLRVDHVLPSRAGFHVLGGGVFWPASTDPLYALLFLSASQTQSNQTTDHRLVYMDVEVIPVPSQAVRNLRLVKTDGDAVLTWGTQTGVTYRLQTSPDLATWAEPSALIPALDTATQTATASDAGAGAASLGQRFYRIICTLDGP